MLVIAATVILAGPWLHQCCEYLGLLAPEGKSEVPGVPHISSTPARADGEIPEEVPGLKLHGEAGEIVLPDLHGVLHKVDFSARPLTVLVWVSTVCPTSMIYEERLNILQREFGDHVTFWAVNSSEMEEVQELRDHYINNVREDRLRLMVLKDDRNVICDHLGARRCPEAFVFDRKGRLQYRGGVDDNRKPQDVKRHYLREVLADLLEGRQPRLRYAPSTGCCPIARIVE